MHGAFFERAHSRADWGASICYSVSPVALLHYCRRKMKKTSLKSCSEIISGPSCEGDFLVLFTTDGFFRETTRCPCGLTSNKQHGSLIFAYAKRTQQWVFWPFLATSYCSNGSSEQKRATEVRVWLSACTTWVFSHHRQEHERMGECLMAERDRFMAVLEKERRERANLEAFACSIIQAAYRGYLLRQRHVARNYCYSSTQISIPRVFALQFRAR